MDENLLLALDCGNSQIKCGVFRGRELAVSFRLATDPDRTSDEYAGLIRAAMLEERVDPRTFAGAILSSVVPPVQPLLKRAVEKLLKCPCQTVSAQTDTGITIKTADPSQVGADLICLAAAAADRYPLPAIVVSFGTATAVVAINRERELCGVAIAPGILMAARSLASGTAQLHQVELTVPKSALGKNTTEAIQAGLIFGFAGLTDRLIFEMTKELGHTPSVIATGGLLNLMAPVTLSIRHYEPVLALHGLQLIWKRLAAVKK